MIEEEVEATEKNIFLPAHMRVSLLQHSSQAEAQDLGGGSGHKIILSRNKCSRRIYRRISEKNYLLLEVQ